MKKLSLIVALLIAITASAQEAQLCFKPVANKKFNVEIQSKIELNQNMGGMEVKVNVSSEGKCLLSIENVAENGDITMISQWNEIKASTSAMGIDTTMVYKDLNIKIKTVYNKNGKIIQSEKLESLNPEVAQMADQLMRGVKFPFYPCKAVKNDEKWSSESSETVPAGALTPFEISTNSTDNVTFLGSETKNGVEYHKLKLDGPLQVSGKGSQMGMDMNIEGTGSNSGFAWLDKTTGFPAYIEMLTGMDMNVAVSGAQSMAIPMTQNITTTITFTEVTK